ncbi:SDR family NAD(P)-dependent oxidoreductase [Fluviicola sp.]|jgi:NADP-dependent 3-hydroxy acid dehydrogenase YdfG|uniref:SDR family NAD(P)-dependent oxidoreductase n=1 Tax=Fluviicola sp. TaxID=1917219 RepID=UPI00282F1124|nr:SDR family NAD(P)-dependent oxidoreductase [Fluviicola sp.]MDR0802837.1 SDR family NAD(P)-dependent oxidoreductase [Fluviicola sp.]
MRKYVFITGATAGFGEATARIFAKNGWNLVLTGRRKERLEMLRSELSEEQVDIVLLNFDVRSEDEVNQAVSSLSEEVKNNLIILINNAGLAVGRGPIDSGDTDDWNRMIDTNVKGLLYVTRAVSPILKQNGGGNIVNIASIAGKEVYAGGNVYCATKHAVDALSRAMRIDLVHDNIKVTNIAPGAAETEFSLVRFKGNEETAKLVYDGYDALLAEDIADAVYYVCSRPKHVCINDLVIMPTAQASSTIFHKTH